MRMPQKLTILLNLAEDRDGTGNITLKIVIHKYLIVFQSHFHEENWISSLDFNVAGEAAATIDRYGTCLISDLNSDDCKFHLKTGSKPGNILVV